MNKKDNVAKTIGPINAKVIHELLAQGKTIFVLDDARAIYGEEGKRLVTFFVTW